MHMSLSMYMSMSMSMSVYVYVYVYVYAYVCDRACVYQYLQGVELIRLCLQTDGRITMSIIYCSRLVVEVRDDHIHCSIVPFTAEILRSCGAGNTGL